MNDFDIRPVAIEERRAATDTLRAALLSGPINDKIFESIQASWDECDALAAWDGARCVGHVGAFHFDSTVPGGAKVRTAGVTRVGVLPTHIRKGLLSQLMHRLLSESRERRNVLATLHASETSIYRRFGFGLATDAVAVQITAANAKPWRVASAPGSLRLLAYTEVLDVVPDLYERVARGRVGTISRPNWMWQRILKDASRPTETQHGKGSFVAVHTDVDGNDDGYIYYDVDWDERFAVNPTGVGTMRDLWGASPAVEVELWRYLLSIDLITTWQAAMRPVDEPVRRAMNDSRAYEVRQRIDDQWVRILDTDAALRERHFGPARSDVSINVQDPMFADNCGTWTLSSGGAYRNDDAAFDIGVDIATLSAAYLGAVSWHDLHAAGALSTNCDADVLDTLDTHFAWRPTPFCGTGY